MFKPLHDESLKASNGGTPKALAIVPVIAKKLVPEVALQTTFAALDFGQSRADAKQLERHNNEMTRILNEENQVMAETVDAISTNRDSSQALLHKIDKIAYLIEHTP